MNARTAAKFDKILALIDNAGTKGEAEAAAAAFQRMLLRHGVSEDEARDAASFDQSEPYVAKWITVCPPRSHDTGWKSALMRTLAGFSLCRAYQRAKGGWHEVMVIGKPSDIIKLTLFFDRCAGTFDRLADEDVRRMKARAVKKGYRAPQAGGWRNSFLHGAVSGLYDAMRAERAKLAGDPHVSALVIMRDDELNAAERRFAGDVGQVTPRANCSDSAWQAGYAAGQRYRDAAELGDRSQAAVGALDG